MAPFAAEVLERAAAEPDGIVLILDQSKLSERHQVLMLALRHGERALPLAGRGDGRRDQLCDAEGPARRRRALAPGGRRGVPDGRPVLRNG